MQQAVEDNTGNMEDGVIKDTHSCMHALNHITYLLSSNYTIENIAWSLLHSNLLVFTSTTLDKFTCERSFKKLNKSQLVQLQSPAHDLT